MAAHLLTDSTWYIGSRHDPPSACILTAFGHGFGQLGVYLHVDCIDLRLWT